MNPSWKPPFTKYKKKSYLNIAKTADFIYQLGESPILREVSKEVPIEQIKSKEFQEKIKSLKDCLLKYRKLTGNGRGISAVQVGVPERICVLNLEGKKAFLVLINPKIVKTSEKLYRHPEMCMSLGPIVAYVIRPAWIEIEYFDESGNKCYWLRKDNTKRGRSYNRVLQHEIDHLNGVLMIDKIELKDIVLDSDPNWYKNAKYEEVKE